MTCSPHLNHPPPPASRADAIHPYTPKHTSLLAIHAVDIPARSFAACWGSQSGGMLSGYLDGPGYR